MNLLILLRIFFAFVKEGLLWSGCHSCTWWKTGRYQLAHNTRNPDPSYA